MNNVTMCVFAYFSIIPRKLSDNMTRPNNIETKRKKNTFNNKLIFIDNNASGTE
jgi:hypothetical protein